jgi:hypothetical protein
MMRRHRNTALVIGVCVALTLYAAVTSAGRRSYSTKPLKEPVRDAAANVVEFTKFNNWLNANYESAPPDRRQALKEHLYSIIDSDIKQLHERQGVTYPSDSDIVLSGCYAWAARMGVYGANMVLDSLNPLKSQDATPPASLPESFTLILDGDLFVLSSSVDAWRVTFPYYFMLGDLRDVETTNGLRTQMAVVSTGFGRHVDGKGYSQATIMLVFSPAGSASVFNEFWLEKFSLTKADRIAERVQHMPAYRRYDVKSKMHTEVVFPKTGSGAMVIGYMGLDGTYQWNRPHFEDFLASLLLKSAE